MSINDRNKFPKGYLGLYLLEVFICPVPNMTFRLSNGAKGAKLIVFDRQHTAFAHKKN